MTSMQAAQLQKTDTARHSVPYAVQTALLHTCPARPEVGHINPRCLYLSKKYS